MQSAIPVFLSLIVCIVAKGPVKFQLELDGEIPLDGISVLPFAFEKEINKTINNIISKIPDPIDIPKLVIDKDSSPSFRANITLENLKFLGASSIAARNIKFDLIKTLFDITIHVGKIDFSTLYDADVQLLFVPFYGKGSARLEVDNVEIELHAKLKVGKPTVLSELSFHVTVDDINFQLTGFLNDDAFSDIVSAAVSENLPDFIKKYCPVLSKKVSKIIQSIVNEILKPKPKPKFPVKGYTIPLDDGKIYYEL